MAENGPSGSDNEAFNGLLEIIEDSSVSSYLRESAISVASKIRSRSIELVRYGRSNPLTSEEEIETEEGEEVVRQFNLDLLEEEYAEVRLVEKGETTPVLTEIESEEHDAVELNIEALPDEQKGEVTEYITDVFHKQGFIFSPNVEDDRRLIESRISDKQIKDILNFFEKHLNTSQLTLLRRSLYIRQDWESESYTSRGEMSRRRTDLRNKFGDKAYTVSNWCSSGYYDEGGFIRNLFEGMEDHGHERETITRVYNELLDEEPFTVYVGPYSKPSTVKEELKEKLEGYDSHIIDMTFIDARAQGYRNREILDQAILELQKEVNEIKYKAMIDDRETVYRLYPESVTGL